ncbi:MAG: rhodanese-like domain-containing protein [Bacillota bacterium]
MVPARHRKVLCPERCPLWKITGSISSKPDHEKNPMSPVYPGYLIPLGEVQSRSLDHTAYPELESSVPIVVYCKSGIRSLTATPILRRAGFATSHSFKGGIFA